MTTIDEADALLTAATPLAKSDAAERFRFSNRYGQRFYRDDLPACPLAPTGEVWEGPAISTIKKAWSKEFTKRLPTGLVVPLDGLRCGRFVSQHLDSIVGLTPESICELVATEPRRDLDRAAQRGTGVHAIMDAYKTGREPAESALTDEARLYIPCARQIIADLRPEFVYAETVAISRTIGVGGTFDVVLGLPDGTLWLTDWKTRSPDSNHGCYEEEACQLGFYGRADYWITEVDGEPRRVAVPELAGGLIVSIKPDSYELYPIDLDKGLEAVGALKDCWDRKREGQAASRKAIGRPMRLRFPADSTTSTGSESTAVGTEPIAAEPRPPESGTPTDGNPPPATPGGESTPDELLDARRVWITERVQRLVGTPTGIAYLTAKQAEDGLPRVSQSDHAQIDQWSANIDIAETRYQLPFPDPDPGVVVAEALLRAAGMLEMEQTAPEPEPAGEWAPEADREGLAARLKLLPGDLLAPINDAARDAGIPHLFSGAKSFTAEHAEALNDLVQPAESVYCDRKTVIEEALAETAGGDVDMEKAILLAAYAEGDAPTDLASQRIVSVCEWLGADLLHLVPLFDEETPYHVVADPDGGEKALLKACGSKRQAIAVTKEIAAAHGVATPKSVTQIVSDPLLLALALTASKTPRTGAEA